MLTDKAIDELQVIWREETGEELSREETEAMGMRLVNLMQIVYDASLQRQAAQSQGEQVEMERPRSAATIQKGVNSIKGPGPNDRGQLSMFE